MGLAGTVVASWSLTQEVAGLSPFNENYFLSLNSLNSVKTSRESSAAFSKNAFVVVVYCYVSFRVSGSRYRAELCNTSMMRDVLKKMRIPETKALHAHEKAFKDLKYLYNICNETLDVSILHS